MTPRELEVLNTIYELGDQCSLESLRKRIGLSREYSSLLSKALRRGNLIGYGTTYNILRLTPKGRQIVEDMSAGRGEITSDPVEVARHLENQIIIQKPALIFHPQKTADLSFPRKWPGNMTDPELGKAFFVSAPKEPMIIETGDARSIEKSIERLTLIHPVRTVRKTTSRQALKNPSPPPGLRKRSKAKTRGHSEKTPKGKGSPKRKGGHKPLRNRNRQRSKQGR